MTIIEALKESKESGKSYMRACGSGGFARWAEGYTYKLDTEDLLADDWEPMETGISKLTGGRWGAASK